MSFGFSAGDFISAATLTYKLIHALSDSSGSSIEYQQLIQDLSCVHRTLLQIDQMHQSHQLNQSTLHALAHQVDSTRKPIEDFLARTEKYRHSLTAGGSGNWGKDSWRKIGWSLHKKDEVRVLREVLQLRLLSINILLSTACYFVARPIRNDVPPGFLQDITPEYELEEETAVPTPDWNSNLVVFEHINMNSGGIKIQDPGFRTPTPATTFFRVGQVFMILWDTTTASPQILPNAIADDEPSLTAERQHRAAMANVYRGPYTGSTTVRRFFVVHEGVRSSYCLPITTLSLTGSTHQPDPENYGQIYTGSAPPPLLAGETNMVKLPVRVNAAHPSLVLPVQARIDYRRLCEVEHGVRVKDVGLVDVDSMVDLLGGLEPVRVEGIGGVGKGGMEEERGGETGGEEEEEEEEEEGAGEVNGEVDIGIE